jgi:hypothetical protein
MSGFFYFYRTHTSLISGSAKRRERCANCSTVYEYKIERTAKGGGHSPFGLGNDTARLAAKMRAENNLARALEEDIEPVSCPRCGEFQPKMVALLKARHGKLYEPNQYAADRIATPAREAWQIACATNTKGSYKKFKEVWPTLSSYSDARLNQLRFPPLLRKFTSAFSVVLWAGCLIFLLVAVIATNFLR